MLLKHSLQRPRWLVVLVLRYTFKKGDLSSARTWHQPPVNQYQLWDTLDQAAGYMASQLHPPAAGTSPGLPQHLQPATPGPGPHKWASTPGPYHPLHWHWHCSPAGQDQPRNFKAKALPISGLTPAPSPPGPCSQPHQDPALPSSGQQFLYKTGPGSQPGQGPALPTSAPTVFSPIKREGPTQPTQGTPLDNISLVIIEECAAGPHMMSPLKSYFSKIEKCNQST